LPNGPGGQPREFICFEPLTTIINGVNLAHDGKWSGLQTLAPAKSGRKASGFGRAEFETRGEGVHDETTLTGSGSGRNRRADSLGANQSSRIQAVA
jgi:hypothetical protein